MITLVLTHTSLSYCGLPARPIICNISSGDNSTQDPFSGEYICVPFSITVCAGKFTPHASVAVDISTYYTMTWCMTRRTQQLAMKYSTCFVKGVT
jgi:hypothetical protein